VAVVSQKQTTKIFKLFFDFLVKSTVLHFVLVRALIV